MGLSRQDLYRKKCNAETINTAYLWATGEFKRELPDPEGLDPVQRQNRKAKKSGFVALKRQLEPA
jgi:hypothetical protein